MDQEVQTVTGYAPVNGVDVYWESRGGGGTPLLLVHGGFGLASDFDHLAGQFAAGRQVIAVELRGHGHSGDDARPFSYDDFADDIAGVLRHLGIGQADLLGYSLGGGASLRCAIRHPETVRRLVLISTPFRRAAWFPEILAAFDQMTGATQFAMMRHSPMYAAWAKVAPDPESFPVLIDKTGALQRAPYDWTDEVSQLKMPVLLVYGDADSIPPAHAAEFFALLGGGLRDAGWNGTLPSPSRLAILPGRTHYNMLASALLPPTVTEFLAAP